MRHDRQLHSGSDPFCRSSYTGNSREEDQGRRCHPDICTVGASQRASPGAYAYPYLKVIGGRESIAARLAIWKAVFRHRSRFPTYAGRYIFSLPPSLERPFTCAAYPRQGVAAISHCRIDSVYLSSLTIPPIRLAAHDDVVCRCALSPCEWRRPFASRNGDGCYDGQIKEYPRCGVL